MTPAREFRKRRHTLPKLDLRARLRVEEWMDDPGLDPELHRAALAGLRRLNRWSAAEFHLGRVLAKLQDGLGGGPLRVVDLASGSGDLPIGLDRRMRKAGRPFAFSGCDVSPTAVAEATRRALGSGVEFHQRDVLAEGVPPDYDVVTCSLFFHHLADEQVLALFGSVLRSGARALAVSDLDRSKLNYRAVWLASRVLTRSPVVRFDATASVRSAYTPPEMLALARRAGLEGARVVRAFPARWLLTWVR